MLSPLGLLNPGQFPVAGSSAERNDHSPSKMLLCRSHISGRSLGPSSRPDRSAGLADWQSVVGLNWPKNEGSCLYQPAHRTSRTKQSISFPRLSRAMPRLDRRSVATWPAFALQSLSQASAQPVRPCEDSGQWHLPNHFQCMLLTG